MTYFLRQSDLPLKVGLLIDVSGSVGTFFRAQQQAAAIFLQQTLRASDSATVISFGVESRVIQDFTWNLESLTKAVHGLSAGEPATAIYDAVSSSCARLSARAESALTRRVLILITDGEENSSHSSIEDAIDAALQSDVIVFALNTNPIQAFTDPMLQKLSQSTGGRVLHANGARELKSAAKSMSSCEINISWDTNRHTGRQTIAFIGLVLQPGASAFTYIAERGITRSNKWKSSLPSCFRI